MPEAVYAFEVLSAVDGKSKAGDDQTTITLGIYDAANNIRRVKDWLNGSSNRGEAKIQAFAESIGMLTQYEAGNLPTEDLAGKEGYVKISKQTSEKYGTQNNVSYYVPNPPEGAVMIAPPAPQSQQPFSDESVPF